jgi:uncharacterized protein (TIGR04145 family)
MQRKKQSKILAVICSVAVVICCVGGFLPQTAIQSQAASVTGDNDGSNQEAEGGAASVSDADQTGASDTQNADDITGEDTEVQSTENTTGENETVQDTEEGTEDTGVAAASEDEDAEETVAEEVPEGFEDGVDATEAVYAGITIDGDFSDWDAIDKTGKIEGTNDCLWDAAAIWDGDYVYLYLMENPNWYDGNIHGASPYYNGNFMIQTSRGDKTSLKIQGLQLVEAPAGATLAYNNHQYEIAVPVTSLKGFKVNSTSSLNFGVMGDDWYPDIMIVGGLEDVSRIDTDDVVASTKTEIKYDYDFTDWDNYPHEIIQYSSAGIDATDSAIALYSDGDQLFGHVSYYNAYYSYSDIFSYLSLAVNGDYGNYLPLTCYMEDDEGNVYTCFRPDNFRMGRYEYHIFGMGDSYNPGAWTTDYGKLYLEVSPTGAVEAEFVISLEKVAAYYHMEQTDFKTIHMQFIRIGYKWVTTAGTSTGPIVGILLCVGVVVAAQVYRKKRHIRPRIRTA